MSSLDDILDYINKHTEVQTRLYTGHTKLYPYIEFEYFSGLGLHCLVTLWLEKESVDAFFEAITNHCKEYPNRCEEDLESYIRERPDETEDFSVRELVDDADWKVKFWTDFVNDLKSKFLRL